MRRAVLVVLLTLCGCASLPTLTERPEEYALYRAARIAPTLEERLRAADRYLREVPRGRRAEELRAWFVREEEKYYLSAFNRIGALYAYRAALPAGPHIAEVESRIASLESRREKQRQKASAEDDAIAEGQARLEQAARDRRAFVTVVRDWTMRLTRIRSFGEPTSELDDETIFAFRLSPPRGACQGDSCKKLLQLEYRVPGERTLLERVALLEVELSLSRGLLQSARIAGPALWTRLGEALSLAPLGTPSAEERSAAVARSSLLIQGAIEARFPRESCERPVAPPVILDRACQGVHARMIVGEGADDDVFEVSVAAPAREP